MPAYKEKDRNTWTVKIKHKNWSGQIKWVTKRGFTTKREALQYERDFLARKSGNLDMSFADFVQVYREERGARIKESTLSMKDNIIDTKLIPYFGKKCMREITTKDIMLWQNELLTYRDPKDGKPYSKSYLKTIHNQLSAIFNHAGRTNRAFENSSSPQDRPSCIRRISDIPHGSSISFLYLFHCPYFQLFWQGFPKACGNGLRD